MKPRSDGTPFWRRCAAAGVLVAGLLAAAHAQLGVVTTADLPLLVLTGSPGPGIAVAPGHFAARERVGTQERYVTGAGAQGLFDRLRPGGLWMGTTEDTRLVYLADSKGVSYLVDGAQRIGLPGVPTSPAGLGRIWPSRDRSHYVAFAKQGTKIRWYLDGALQAQHFDALPLVPMQAPDALPLFAARASGSVRLVGHPMSGATRWTRLDRVLATADGQVVYAQGLQGNTMVLQKNGADLYRGVLDSLRVSQDGAAWLAARRVAPTAPGKPTACELLLNGVVVSAATVDCLDQQTWLSDDGSSWRWLLAPNEDSGAVLRAPQAPDRKLPGRFLELVLSGDGQHELLATSTDQTPANVRVALDGQQIALETNVERGSLQFGSPDTWALVATDGKRRWVVSNKGRAPGFEEISALGWLTDGQVAYVASAAPGVWYAGVGTAIIPLFQGSVHHLGSLRIVGNRMQVLATNGARVVVLSVGAP